MKILIKNIFFIIIAPAFIAGCSSQDKTINVRISSQNYAVNDVISSLATPVVDEVVKNHPKKVMIFRCPNTPNSKIIQFERELRARHMSELQMKDTEEGCIN